MQERQHNALAHAAIGNLQRLTELFEQRRKALARSVGLTEQQWRVLEEISTEHFIPSLFARHQESSPAAVSKVTRQLLEKGLIRVSISDTDGRQRNYDLTGRGRRAMEELRARRQRAVDDIWTTLSRDELEAFIDLSATLVRRIEGYQEAEQGEEV